MTVLAIAPFFVFVSTGLATVFIACGGLVGPASPRDFPLGEPAPARIIHIKKVFQLVTLVTIVTF